jgi:hypothetical protein
MRGLEEENWYGIELTETDDSLVCASQMNIEAMTAQNHDDWLKIEEKREKRKVGNCE